MKKHTLTVLFLIFIALFSAFASGTKDKVETQEEMRIISLAPNMTELVYALGCGDYLIGRTESCDYPQECLSVPVAADMWMPSVESIVALDPTLVLVSSLTDPTCIKAIEDAGINIKQLNYDESLEGTETLIKEVGLLLNKEKKAQELIDDFNNKINSVKTKVSSVKEKKSCIYIISWGDWGDFAATGDTFINDMIETAGGINAAGSASFWAISKELLLEQNPDVVLLPNYPYMDADINGFISTAPYSQLTGKILTIDGNSTERQGIRTADTVEEIAKILYPELF